MLKPRGEITGLMKGREMEIQSDDKLVGAHSDHPLLVLAEQCEKASGPDRLLDREIGCAALGWKRFTLNGAGMLYCGDDAHPDHPGSKYPALTESIDAALTLLPRGWSVQLYLHDGENSADIYLLGEYEPSAHRTFGGRRVLSGSYEAEACKTPALALCAAALRAQHAQRQGERT